MLSDALAMSNEEAASSSSASAHSDIARLSDETIYKRIVIRSLGNEDMVLQLSDHLTLTIEFVANGDSTNLRDDDDEMEIDGNGADPSAIFGGEEMERWRHLLQKGLLHMLHLTYQHLCPIAPDVGTKVSGLSRAVAREYDDYELAKLKSRPIYSMLNSGNVASTGVNQIRRDPSTILPFSFLHLLRSQLSNVKVKQVLARYEEMTNRFICLGQLALSVEANEDELAALSRLVHWRYQIRLQNQVILTVRSSDQSFAALDVSPRVFACSKKSEPKTILLDSKELLLQQLLTCSFHLLVR
jgi:hypothetical protein